MILFSKLTQSHLELVNQIDDITEILERENRLDLTAPLMKIFDYYIKNHEFKEAVVYTRIGDEQYHIKLEVDKDYSMLYDVDRMK